MPAAAVAGEARTQFRVTAYVAARATLESVAQPAQVAVSAVDIERGYVDVAAVYRVSSNDPAGYLLRLAPLGGVAAAVEVSGLSSRVVLREESVDVMQPAALSPQRLAVTFRFVLDPAAVPGTYEWPVQLAAYTL